MPRDLTISRKLFVVHIAGLVPPRSRPDAHVLLWTVDGRRRPDYLRWVWHPITGNFAAGIVHRHAELIRASDPASEFYSWLRGFRFPRERIIAMRTYHWPADPYENFNAELDQRVVAAATDLLRPYLSRHVWHSGVDNAWLQSRFGKYAMTW